MKRTFVVFLILGGIALTAAAASPAAAATSSANWTFAVYACGDNDLDYCWARFTLPGLENIGDAADVSVVAMVDHYRTRGTTLYEFHGGDPTTAATFPEKNFGSGNTFKWFLQEVTTRYPADNLVVVMWDHGYGWRYICRDDTSNDRITMPELRNAIVDSGRKIDILAFDACNMQDVEVAWELAKTGKVDYLVGSEETIDQDGLPYDGMIRTLQNNSSITSRDCAAAMVDSYERYYKPLRCFTWVNLVAFDVQRLATAEPAVTAWVAALKAALPLHRAVYADILNHTIYAWDCWHVDLPELADHLATDARITDVTLKTASAALKTELDACVVNNWSGSYADEFGGTTIWWGEGGDWRWYKSDYAKQPSFATEAGWYEFLKSWNADVWALAPGSSQASAGPWPHKTGAVDQARRALRAQRAGTYRAPPDPVIERARYGLTDVCFADAQHGWAVGYQNVTNNAIILRTIDGGATWTCRSTPSWWAYQFGAVTARSGAKAWAVGSEGWPDSVIVGTGNGGGIWKDQASHTKQYLLSVDFVSDTEGWAAGTGPILLHTTDGGAHWTRMPLPDGIADIWGVDFVDALHGTIVGGHYPTEQGYIRQTSDGGNTWTLKQTLVGAVVSSVKWVSGTTGYALCGDPIGGRPIFFRTTDGGATWPSLLSLPFPGPWLADVEAFDAGSPVWVVGELGSVFTSTNGGDVWGAKDIGATADLTAVDFVDANNGWIVGDCERLYFTTDGGTNWHFRVADATGPTCVAWDATVKSGGNVSLVYRVNDDMSSRANVTLKVTTLTGRVLSAVHAGWKPTGAEIRAIFKCNLQPGAYRFKVYAVDEATNPQTKIGKATLTVR